MIKQFVASLLIPLFLVSQSVSMDQLTIQMNQLAIQSKNPFALLPIDVQNLIASYLDIETEQEFIERTRQLHKQPISYDPTVPIFQDVFIFCASSPKQKKTAVLFSQLINGHIGYILNVRNEETEKCEPSIQLNHDRSIVREYSHLALSSNGKFVAMVHLDTDNNGQIRPYPYNATTTSSRYITIHAINSGKIEVVKQEPFPASLKCPTHIDHPGIAFNKQDTHLIIHGFAVNDNIYYQKEMPTHHTIIQWRTIDESLTKETLALYFYMKAVCTKIN